MKNDLYNFEKGKYEHRKRTCKQRINVDDLKEFEPIKVGSKTNVEKLTFFKGGI